MDLGRFHRGIEQLDEYYKSTGLSEQLSQMVSELSALGATSSNQDAVVAFRSRLTSLGEALIEREATLEGPAQEVIQALDIEDAVGDRLFEELTDTLAKNQLTPTLAAQALSDFKSTLDTTILNVARVNGAFTALGVEYEELDEGESELSLSIPAERDDRTLVDLSKETKDWNFVISTLSEVFDAEHPVATIRTIASGSWLLYLSSTPMVLWGIANTLKQLNKILLELGTLRKQIEQLSAMKAPTKELEKHQEKKLSSDIEVLAESLVKINYKGKDEGRKKELVNATSQALKTLARKIATGSTVKMRIGPVPKAAGENEDVATAEQKQLMKVAKEFAVQKEMAEKEIAQLQTLDLSPEIVPLLPAPIEEGSAPEEKQSAPRSNDGGAKRTHR